MNITIKKVVVMIAVVIGLMVFYHYLKPKYYLKNTEAKNLPCKISPFRDSIYVYIPYKLTIYNNRISNLRISNVYDGYSRGHGYGKKLLYNLDDLELHDFWNGSKKLKVENNYANYGDKAYWRIQHTIEYKDHIFPFLGRTFYYYKRFTLSNKNDRFKIKKFSRDSINRQLYTLNYNLTTSIEKSTIDSLYTINNNKRFNIHFDSETLIIKRIRANINTEAQEMVYDNLYDSIKGMNDEEKRNTILKLLERQPKDDF